MDTFESAINNYRTSTGTIAQGMLQGTVGQLESQQEMSETKAQILSAADNSDQQTNVAVNMSDTLDKIGLDFGVKEVGAKILPWAAKKLAGHVVKLRAAEAQLGGRNQTGRVPDPNNPASGDGTRVGGGRGAGGDAGNATQPAIGPRRAPGKAPPRAKASGDDDEGDDAGFGSSDINIAGKGTADDAVGDALSSLRGGDGTVNDLLRATAPGSDVSLSSLLPGTTSRRIGALFSNQAEKLSRGVKLGSNFDVNDPGTLRVSVPRMNRIPNVDETEPFAAPTSVRPVYTSGGPVNRLPGARSDVTARPTALTSDADAAAAAARRTAITAGADAESSFGTEALGLASKTIGALADVLGPAAAIYGIIEAGHGLYEDAKLQSDNAFKQANTVIAQATQQQNNLASDISADQFASKVGASRPSFGSLAAPSMDTSQMAGGGSQQF